MWVRGWWIVGFNIHCTSQRFFDATSMTPLVVGGAELGGKSRQVRPEVCVTPPSGAKWLSRSGPSSWRRGSDRRGRPFSVNNRRPLMRRSLSAFGQFGDCYGIALPIDDTLGERSRGAGLGEFLGNVGQAFPLRLPSFGAASFDLVLL